MTVALAPDQQAWINAHVARGEFTSLDDAVQTLVVERITERMIEEDDLAWAKPLVDDALVAVARRDVIDRDAHEARMDALIASLKA